ncbi:MAG: 6-phosphofructokinase [Anaerolineales bacterium]|nr:6-phosphofructokinase [Anaerolineales bacterium]
MNIQTVGVLTSGGDAPGINPSIRAVVRTALYHGMNVIGVQEGFDGLIRGEMSPLRARDVGGILQRGGTFLRTARCPEFKTKKGQRQAVRELNESRIDALVVIGGDGSMRGAKVLVEQGVLVVGIPASIDNDIWGTDMSLGVDTALNTLMEAVDKLRDTASSHQRAFLVVTMGRDCGYLALITGVICGAEIIIIPEKEIPLEAIAPEIEAAYARGKTHAIIVMAEGASHSPDEIQRALHEADVGFETRVTILGHIVRGGSPSAFDRLLATRMGVAAVDALIEGKTGVMTGLRGREIVLRDLDEVTSKQREPNLHYLEIGRMLSR